MKRQYLPATSAAAAKLRQKAAVRSGWLSLVINAVSKAY